MLTDDGKHLYVSWDEYHMLIERLALKIAGSGWEFDQILCLARGGMRPGDVLSRWLLQHTKRRDPSNSHQHNDQSSLRYV